MIETAIAQIERNVVAGLHEHLGRRCCSQQLGAAIQQLVGARMGGGEISRDVLTLLRLAIKATPYDPNVATMLDIEGQLLRAWAKTRMAGVIATIDQCRARGLPVPLIVSCAKYMAKAREAQAALAARYFDIVPVIVRGDGALSEEQLEGTELILPCDDSYEGLPIKIFDAFTFLHDLGATSGILKIDDDLVPLAAPGLDAAALVEVFRATDYCGQTLRHLGHDRSWHFGKCMTPVPVVYAKPFLAPWARGALYYVSGRALGLLAQHYLRFPGIVEGELYEDKAVGDVLHQLGIVATHRPLEALLGIGTDAPERMLVAAE